MAARVRPMGCRQDEPEAERLTLSARSLFLNQPATLVENASVAQSASDRTWLAAKHMQGTQNSCVAFAVADALRFARLKNKLKAFNPSEQYLYNQGRLQGGVNPEFLISDQGSSIYQVLMAAVNSGVAPLSVMTYGRVQQVPSASILKQAALRKVTAFYRIDTDKAKNLGELKLYLSQGWPVVFGTWVYTNMLKSKTQWISEPGNTDTIAGGHAMLAYGYDKQYLYAKNWWSDLPTMAIDWKYFERAGRLDCWCVQGIQQ
jgi:hypothetical protein